MPQARAWTGFEAVALQEAMRLSVRQFADKLGVEVTTVSRWRSGLGSTPLRARTQQLLDVTLRLHADEHVRARFDEIVAAGESMWRASNGKNASRHRKAAAPNGFGEVHSFERPAGIIERMRKLSNGNVEEPVLIALDIALRDLLSRYELEGPAQLVPDVLALRHQTDELVQQCRHPDHLARLYRIAGQTSGALAYMAVNVGRFRHAEVYIQETVGLAKFTGDQQLMAWTRGTESFAYYYQGEYSRAVDAAREGIRVADGSREAIRLYSNGLARALGKIGDSEGVKRAVADAVKLGETCDAPSGLTPALSFEPYGAARVMANAATAHLSAGEFQQTLDYGQLVSELVDTSDSVWSQALVRLDVATAFANQTNREVEHAMKLGMEALTACREQPIRSVWQRAHDLASSVATADTAAVSEYTEQLRSWSKANAAVVQDRLAVAG
ncbi:hypothetical protein [Nocardia camponoti]|uniref:Uncharacterized protein n=1 Tax=Nocardia camponoti TaxID=1616106 RepID=A0A917Q9D6_9NOCA|nr:hypothetical protein [Nocardia camponoti]GGK33974.1 hypothetical protein GCM10011591_02060 [Nocardia camponoti]